MKSLRSVRGAHPAVRGAQCAVRGAPETIRRENNAPPANRPFRSNARSTRDARIPADYAPRTAHRTLRATCCGLRTLSDARHN